MDFTSTTFTQLAPKLTLLLTLCGLTDQKPHRGGLGLSGLVHEEAHLVSPILLNHLLKELMLKAPTACWSSWFHPIHLLSIPPEFGRITQNNGHYDVQGSSRSPILVAIENPRDFLLLINTNLHLFSHRFQVRFIAYY